MEFVTLYIVWWCCDRTHDVVSGTTVHTSPTRLLWCCCTTSQLSFFFFFTLRAMKNAQSTYSVVCFWVVSLLNFFCISDVVSTHFSTLSLLFWVSFCGPLPARFFNCYRFPPTHFFEFTSSSFDRHGAALLCLPIFVGSVC